MTTYLVPPLAPIIIERWARAHIQDARLAKELIEELVDDFLICRLHMGLRDIRVAIADTTTPLLLKVIHKLNPEKDNGLAWRLHELADMYDTRPTGEWD